MAPLHRLLMCSVLPALAAGAAPVGCLLEGEQKDSSAEEVGTASSELTSALTGAMTVAHISPTASKLQNGKVLVVASQTSAVTDLYDPATNTWSATGSLLTARDSHAAVTLLDGRVLIVAGMANNNVRLASAEVYDPATGTWSAAGSVSTARVRHTATTLASGRVLVTGGLNDSGAPITGADLFNPSTSTWAPAAPLLIALSLHTATLLADGRVLVAGGFYPVGTGIQPSASAYLYDPTANTWSATGSLANARGYHKAVRLSDGRVLVAGGQSAAACLAPTEIYDPATGATLTPTAAGKQTLTAGYVLPAGATVQAVRAAFRYGGSASSCRSGPYDDRDDLAFTVATPTDTTPPAVALTSPAAGSVSGLVTLAATASDNVGVAAVDFLVDGAVLATVSSAPYTTQWNSTLVANGSHNVAARARAAGGDPDARAARGGRPHRAGCPRRGGPLAGHGVGGGALGGAAVPHRRLLGRALAGQAARGARERVDYAPRWMDAASPISPTSSSPPGSTRACPSGRGPACPR